MPKQLPRWMWHLLRLGKLEQKGRVGENPEVQFTSIKSVNPKGNQPWILTGRTNAEAGSSNTLATWWEKLIHWKRPRCWERLKAKGEEGRRGWDGRIASLTQWTWTWANSGRWWGTGRPGNAAVCGVAKSWTRLSEWTRGKSRDSI